MRCWSYRMPGNLDSHVGWVSSNDVVHDAKTSFLLERNLGSRRRGNLSPRPQKEALRDPVPTPHSSLAQQHRPGDRPGVLAQAAWGLRREGLAGGQPLVHERQQRPLAPLRHGLQARVVKLLGKLLGGAEGPRPRIRAPRRRTWRPPRKPMASAHSSSPRSHTSFHSSALPSHSRSSAASSGAFTGWPRFEAPRRISSPSKAVSRRMYLRPRSAAERSFTAGRL